MADSNKTAGRLARAATMVVLGVAATGCIVLPWGPGHGRYGRGHRHYAPPPPAPAGAVIIVPNEQAAPGRRR